MNTVIGTNIQVCMAEQGLTQKELAKKSGVSQVTIHKLIAGKAKETTKLTNIAKALGKTAEWLEKDHSRQWRNFHQKTDAPLFLAESDNSLTLATSVHNLADPSIDGSSLLVERSFTMVPLISSVQAGKWNEIVDNYHPGDGEEWRETTAKVGSKAFALRVVGDSMSNPSGAPSIPEGSVIIVDPDREAVSGKIVVAKLLDSEEVTLKRLVIDGPNVYLKPLNPDYKPIQVSQNCKIVGVVVKAEYDL